MEDSVKQQIYEIESQMRELIKEQKYELVAPLRDKKIQILKENNLYEEPDPNKKDEFLEWLRELNKKGDELLAKRKKIGFNK